jgi:Na+/proline symporter
MSRQSLFQGWMALSAVWVACWLIAVSWNCQYSAYLHELACDFGGRWFKSYGLIEMAAYIFGAPVLVLLLGRRLAEDDDQRPY